MNNPIRAGCNCVYGNVARVVYSRTFLSLTTPQTGRLNKSPHTVHAIANRHRGKVMIREKIGAVFERWADTPFGSGALQLISEIIYGFSLFLRQRTKARSIFDILLQRPIALTVQGLKNLFRRNLRLRI